MAHQAVTFAIPKYFPEDINSAFGFMSAGSAVGMMVFPPVLQFLIDQYGWRGALLLLGAINANNIVCGFLVPVDNEHSYELITSQNDIEEHNDSSVMTSIKNNLKTLTVYLHFLFIEHPMFVVILIADILAGLLFAAWVIFLVPHSVSKGISQKLSAFLSTSGAVGVLVGRLLMGPSIKSGYVTAIQLYIILAFVNAVTFFFDPLGEFFIILIVLAFINGLATGTLVCLSFGCTAEILGEEHVVEGYSVASLTYPIGSLVGGVVLGTEYHFTRLL